MSSSADSRAAASTIVSEIASNKEWRVSAADGLLHRSPEPSRDQDPEHAVSNALTEGQYLEKGIVPVDERIAEVSGVEQPDQQRQSETTDGPDDKARDKPEHLLVLGHALKHDLASDDAAAPSGSTSDR